MRAEAQDHIDKIGAALALLRRFLDGDRAVRRLDELNAKVEDPTLWDSPVSYTHLRAHETVLDLACRLLLAKTPVKSGSIQDVVTTRHPAVKKGASRSMTGYRIMILWVW